MLFTMYVQACLLQDLVARLLTHIVKLNDLVGFIIALVAAIVSTTERFLFFHVLIIPIRSPREQTRPRHLHLAGNESSCWARSSMESSYSVWASASSYNLSSDLFPCKVSLTRSQ